ncbi:MAG: hypothetical protein O2960_11275 [Verrucomicrobia bacterium]|nr:hypothetical protein [Verrucomicrobiota bacterium]
MMPIFKRKPPTSLIGFNLERHCLEGVLLHRNGANFDVRRTFKASLSLDPLTNDPELVGREILNHLNEAGIRERRCTVCLPLNWALTLQTKIPELPEADVPSFLNIEAEKGFPYSPDDLCLAWSRYRTSNGEQYATLVAIPKNHLTRLQSVLKSARLKPLSFSLAISSLQTPQNEASQGVAELLIGETHLELQVTSGDGVVVLRSLEGVIEPDGARKRIDADLVARELKITLGQLPRSLSETVRGLRVFGSPEMAEPFLSDIRDRAGTLGLKLDRETAPQINGCRLPLREDRTILPGLGLAAGRMLGHPPRFEFLPPKISALPQVLARVSARKLVSAGIGLGCVLFLTIAAFSVQHWRLRSLETQWKGIQPKATELEDLQRRIRRYRSWFDESHPTLTIMRKLTEAFPAEGSVWVKRLEIRDLSTVTCSGTAKDFAAFQEMIERLRAVKQVGDLKQDQLQGNSPLQFSINFQWLGGARND